MAFLDYDEDFVLNGLALPSLRTALDLINGQSALSIPMMMMMSALRAGLRDRPDVALAKPLEATPNLPSAPRDFFDPLGQSTHRLLLLPICAHNYMVFVLGSIGVSGAPQYARCTM